MATLEQLKNYAKNDNVRTMLNLIAKAEGTTGYDTAFGGGTIESLDDHPRKLHDFTETTGKKNKTSAAGRYQFLESTWDDVSGKLGLTDFGADSQDLAAIELLRRAGALDDVLKGDFTAAVDKSGSTWASLPSSNYSQPKRSESWVSNALDSLAEAVLPSAQAGEANPFDKFDEKAANPFDKFDTPEANPFDKFDNTQTYESPGLTATLHYDDPVEQSGGDGEASWTDRIGRQIGLTARHGLMGLGEMADIATEPLRQNIVNPMLRTLGMPEANQSASDLAELGANSLGLPSPGNPKERVVGDATRLMAGVGGLVGGAGRLAQGATGLTKTGLEALSASPLNQLVGAAGAGAGSGTAREFGGGPVAQSAAALAGGLFASSAASKVAGPSQGTSKSVSDLKREAGALYDRAVETGVTANPQQTQRLQNDLRALVEESGLITPSGNVVGGYPKVEGALKMIDEFAGQEMTVKQMQAMRKLLKGVAGSIDQPEKRIGSIMLDTFDSFTSPLAPELAEARQLYSAAMRGKELEKLRTLAETGKSQYSQSGFENALRKEYRNLYKNIIKEKVKGFTPEQKEAIRRVAVGTTPGNLARGLGKLAPTGVVSGGFSAGVPFMVGNSMGGPVVGGAMAAGSMGTGVLGRALATNITSKNAAIAEALAKSTPMLTKASSAGMNPMAAIYGSLLRGF